MPLAVIEDKSIDWFKDSHGDECGTDQSCSEEMVSNDSDEFSCDYNSNDSDSCDHFSFYYAPYSQRTSESSTIDDRLFTSVRQLTVESKGERGL